MRKAIVIVVALVVLGLAAPASANVNETITCDGWGISVFDTGANLEVKADNVTVFDGTVDPYLTLSLPWPKVKNTHRLVVTLNGERSVFKVKGCR